MEVSITDQLIITLYSILMGAALGVIYNAIGIIKAVIFQSYSEKILIFKRYLKRKRSTKKINTIVTFFFDLLFFVIITPLMVIFVHCVNNGNLRWYIFFGALTGFLVYRITIGRVIVIILENLAVLFQYAFKTAFEFLYKPIKFAWNKVKRKIKFNRKNKNKVIKNKGKTKTVKGNVVFKIGKK